ncbi:hypothetical protein OHQ88_27920 [Micromonospora zamorensis]|uniref:hypothetical protein n=1 Tax=Micromonospora zamorensis TaxID=709883 RepID=UPI002E1D2964
MQEIWGSLIAVAGTLVGVYLGSRWQAQEAAEHQRSARMHETLVSLYAEVFADTHLSEQYMESLTWPDFQVDGTWPDRAAIGGRLRLLSPLKVQTAWDAYVAELNGLDQYLKGTNYYTGQLLSGDDKYLMQCQKRIDYLRDSVRMHLDEQTTILSTSRRRWTLRNRTTRPPQGRED